MKHFEKIAVKFRKDLYPYSAGDIGMIREDFAKGQFKEFVEILADKKPKTEKKPSNSSVSTPDEATQGEEKKSIEEAPQNKSMSGRTTKNTK